MRGPDLVGVEALLLVLVAFVLLVLVALFILLLALAAPAQAEPLTRQHPCRLADPERRDHHSSRCAAPPPPIARHTNTNDDSELTGAIRPQRSRPRAWGIAGTGCSDCPSA